MPMLSRRGLLAGAALGGGLVVAWSLWPRRFGSPLQPNPDETAFGAWLKIGTDGVVTVAVPQLEMGQGVSTLLPQLVAVELGADWRQVAVQPAPVSGAYANVPLAAKWAPLWLPTRLPGFVEIGPDDLVVQRYAEETRFTATAEGQSLDAYAMPCREAAAAARAMLSQVAADRWDIAWEECEAQNGFVTHGDKRIRFGDLAQEAAELTPPDPPPVRVDGAFEVPVAGQNDPATSFPRLDLPSKVDGSHLFAGDVRLPGMVFAAIRHGPVNQSSLAGFDKEAAESIPGFDSLVRNESWLAALADNWWAAEQVLKAAQPRFTTASRVHSPEIEERLAAAIGDSDDEGEGAEGEKGHVIAERGEGALAIRTPDLELDYEVAPAQHQPLETASATAWLRDGRLELWLGSQAPERARAAVADALGIATEDVILYAMPAGGSFDARLEHDHAIEAALIAREAKRPVQLVWSRWQETIAGYPRAPVTARLSARLADDGSIAILKTRLATPPWGREFGARLFGKRSNWDAIEDSSGKADPMVGEGALPIYDVASAVVEHVPVRTDLPAGKMRGQAHGYTAFMMESFVDEAARASRREPLSYRIEMLSGDLRMVECLQRAARLANWNGGEEGSGQGLACHRIGSTDSGGRIACIATAGPGEGGVRVTRLVAAVDIGRIVNLDIARQQIEGGLIFGLSLALGSSNVYNRGRPENERLAQMQLPLLADSPEIEIDFLTSEAPSFDPGELGVAVAAPAIANALFASTGLRLRRLPLLAGGL
ncbi:MAG: xanthine dehydrogenase family protein molybdopterin-binding subunit [Sphingomonadaceae bacterium]|nr:MAG: xanthine dehydrogenase family protein molybdopterin-binding subunit [Sphingomonadaceae bacterium]